MNTDAEIARIVAAGWRVNNLFQRDDGRWQANLRSPAGCTDFAVAATPCAALKACADKMGGVPETRAAPDLL